MPKETEGSVNRTEHMRFCLFIDVDTKNLYRSVWGPEISTMPDWAIVFREGSVKHVYFIAETKGSMSSLDLRPIEKAKISCAKRLFEKLSNGSVHYDHVDSYEELQKMLLC